MITSQSNKTAATRRFSLWPLGLYRVSGRSMQPLLNDGDLVVGWKWFKPEVGQVVVARTVRHPIIKRIIRIEGQQVWLEGDNAEASTDSRQLGSFWVADLEAKFVYKK